MDGVETDGIMAGITGDGATMDILLIQIGAAIAGILHIITGDGTAGDAIQCIWDGDGITWDGTAGIIHTIIGDGTTMDGEDTMVIIMVTMATTDMDMAITGTIHIIATVAQHITDREIRAMQMVEMHHLPPLREYRERV